MPFTGIQFFLVSNGTIVTVLWRQLYVSESWQPKKSWLKKREKNGFCVFRLKVQRIITDLVISSTLQAHQMQHLPPEASPNQSHFLSYLFSDSSNTLFWLSCFFPEDYWYFYWPWIFGHRLISFKLLRLTQQEQSDPEMQRLWSLIGRREIFLCLSNLSIIF